MKKSLYLIAIFALTSILFSGCKKWFDEPDSKEDLSYLIKTYEFFVSNNNTYKSIWTYDGYRATSYKYYKNGQLYSEYKNYSYDGLNASWDYYSYNNDNVNDISVREHIECEYLDDTYRRIKYQKTECYYPDPQDNCIYETYREYEGKKCVSYKYYMNGILLREGYNYNYDGLHCTYKMTYYTSSNPTIVSEERSYNIVYLDDTYLRPKSSSCTIERVYEDGHTYTSTDYTITDYEGKKIIGRQRFVNGNLSYVYRDYRYDGLTCYYFYDSYREGEVYSTEVYETEYLE